MNYTKLVETTADILLEGTYFWSDASKHIAGQLGVDPKEIFLSDDTHRNYEIFHRPKVGRESTLGRGRGLQTAIQDALLGIKVRSNKSNKVIKPKQGELF